MDIAEFVAFEPYFWVLKFHNNVIFFSDILGIICNSSSSHDENGSPFCWILLKNSKLETFVSCNYFMEFLRNSQFFFWGMELWIDWCFDLNNIGNSFGNTNNHSLKLIVFGIIGFFSMSLAFYARVFGVYLVHKLPFIWFHKMSRVDSVWNFYGELQKCFRLQVVTILHKILDDADVTYEGYEAFNVAGRSWHKSHGYS